MAQSLDRRDAIVLLGMLLVGASGAAKSKAGGSPSTTGAATRTAAAGTTSTTPGSSVAATSTPPTYVRGHNACLTQQVLQSDAGSYNGRWSAQWSVPASGEHGTIDGTVRADPAARSFTVTMTTHGPLLGGNRAVPALAVTVNADSFVYDDATGRFSIRYPTALGSTHLHDDGGFGRFAFEIDAVQGRPDVRSFAARGVANRPDTIPVTFRVTNADGSTRDGTITFHPSK
jgi:hypothetical protein